MACKPLAHNRLTVKPGVVSGRPASSAAIRATLRLSSPDWLAAPKTTSSIASGATPARATASATTSAARAPGPTAAGPRQVVRPATRQRAAVLADGGSDTTNEVRRHAAIVPHRLVSGSG